MNFTDKIINGKNLSMTYKNNIKDKIFKIKEKYNIQPGLAVVLVGDRKDSITYVNMKKKTCEQLGIISKTFTLSESVSEQNIIDIIKSLNNDNTINGILVQLPLPKHINEENILGAVSIEKDVDGFHASNIGNMAMEKRKSLFVPCTPLGCLKILDREKINLKGMNAVVIGKSNIVGLPISLLLMKRNATVTVCHVDTKNIKEHTQKADLLVTACGQPEMIKKDWIKDDCIIIDVGINHIKDENNNTKLVGDVDFKDVINKVSKITPVPGGVGPMTIAMLMKNTFKAFKIQNRNIFIDK